MADKTVLVSAPAPLGAEEAPRRVSLSVLATTFFKVGCFSFGGGTSNWVYRETVLLRSWLSMDEFMAGVALGQILPGANVSNLAVFVGGRLRGAAGAACALVGLLTGPFVLILVMAQLAALLRGNHLFAAVLEGAAASAVGLVFSMAVVGARRFVPKLAPTGVTAAVFAALTFLHWSLFTAVAIFAPVSVAIAYFQRTAEK